MLSLVVLTSIFIVVSLPIFVYWAIIFFIRIKDSRKYMRGAARHLTDEASVYLCKQICYHYQTEIGKYLFLFAITIVEITGGVSSYIEFLLGNYVHTPITHGNISSHVQLERCANFNISILKDFSLDEFTNPLLMVLEAIEHVADMFVAGLGVCLMNYLIGRMKNIDTSIMNIKRFILILSVISVLIILFSVFVYYINLPRFIYISALVVYYIMFLLEVKRFKQALLQMAIERLAQHGSNEIEMRQYRYFSYSMNCVCIGFFCITFSAFVGLLTQFIYIGLFFGKCYFPFYFFSEYEALLPLTDQNVLEIVKILGYIQTTDTIIACIGIFIWLFPMVFITIIIWLKFAHKTIRGKSSVKFRYSGEHIWSN